MPENEIYIALFGAVSLFIVLAGGIIFFVVLYSKRVRHHQEVLRENERKQQLNLLNAAINAQEEERQRIGADIHDDIGPMLATSKLLLNKFLYLDSKVETREHIQKVGSHLDEVIDQIRTVAKNLVPQVLLEFGLQEAVEELCSKINEGNELKAGLALTQRFPELNGAHQLALYRIIQEFCNNTLKHARAQNLKIICESSEKELRLLLKDDGEGITQTQFSSPSGLGIHNMQARAKSIGASIKLENDGSHGTFIAVHLRL